MQNDSTLSKGDTKTDNQSNDDINDSDLESGERRELTWLRAIEMRGFPEESASRRLRNGVGVFDGGGGSTEKTKFAEESVNLRLAALEVVIVLCGFFFLETNRSVGMPSELG